MKTATYGMTVGLNTPFETSCDLMRRFIDHRWNSDDHAIDRHAFSRPHEQEIASRGQCLQYVS